MEESTKYIADPHPKSSITNGVPNEATSSQQQVKKVCKRPEYKFRKIDFVCPDTEWLGSIPPPPKEKMTPLQYYKAFLNDDVFELIAEQSNIYALQKDGISLQTNKSELEQFVGILLQIGIVKMPSIHLYWSFECRYPPIADVMSRNRFFSITSLFSHS